MAFPARVGLAIKVWFEACMYINKNPLRFDYMSDLCLTVKLILTDERQGCKICGWRPHNHYVNLLVVRTALQGATNRSTTAMPLPLVLVHGVLKCVHQFVLKYVMLRHPAVSSHDFLHFSRLEVITDDFGSRTSPAAWLHLTFALP